MDSSDSGFGLVALEGEVRQNTLLHKSLPQDETCICRHFFSSFVCEKGKDISAEDC